MYKFHRILSTIILLSCALGCGYSHGSVDLLTSNQHRNAILSQYPTRAAAAAMLRFAQTLTDEITARLLHDSPDVQVSIDVVDSPAVLSFSYPGGIIVSTALIREMRTEAMFAFVLAHELAHHRLGHTTDLQNQPGYQQSPQPAQEPDSPELESWDSRTQVTSGTGQIKEGQIKETRNKNSLNKDSLNKDLLNKELTADRHAVALLASAAYDVRAALDAVEAICVFENTSRGYLSSAANVLSAAGLPSAASTALSADVMERRAALRTFITQSRWHPPGTISRRVYQELQASLAR